MNEFILLLLEKVCEAVYFSLFLLIGKNIKEKRLLFTAVMVFEYLMLTSIMQFNIWIQILYTFMSFVNLKVFYKDKAQITDIFLFMVASAILMITNIFSYIIIYVTIQKYIVALILSRILMFSILFFIKNNIYNFYKKFFSLWNRHNKPNQIKSLTLRNISIIIFNLMFYILNFIIGVCLILGRR